MCHRQTCKSHTRLALEPRTLTWIQLTPSPATTFSLMWSYLKLTCFAEKWVGWDDEVGGGGSWPRLVFSTVPLPLKGALLWSWDTSGGFPAPPSMSTCPPPTPPAGIIHLCVCLCVTVLPTLFKIIRPELTQSFSSQKRICTLCKCN